MIQAFEESFIILWSICLIDCFAEQIGNDDRCLIIAKCLHDDAYVIWKSKMFVQYHNDKGRGFFYIDISKISFFYVCEPTFKGFVAELCLHYLYKKKY